jgi:predicted ATPase
MAISAEQLNIILTAKDKAFASAMEKNAKRVQAFESKSSKSLKGTSKAFDGLASTAKRLGPALAAAFSVQAIKGAINSAVEIQNLSTLAGVASGEFQILAAASSQFGISQEKLADILKDVNDKFGDFTQTGQGPLKDFFDNIAPKVGLTASAFADLSSDKKLGAYVNALQAANVTQSEMTFYMEAIASDSTALVAAFKDNGAAIEAMRVRAKELGFVLDDSVIANAKQAKADLDLMSTVISSQLTAALINIAPLLTAAASGITSISAAFRDFLAIGGTFNLPVLDAQGLKDASADYNKFKDQIDAVTKAQNRLNGMEKQAAFGKAADPATQAAALQKLTDAENALMAARQEAAQQEAALASLGSSLKATQADSAALEEKIRLQGMSAEAIIRENAAKAKQIFLDKAINDAITASGGNLSSQQYDEIEALANAHEQLAIKAGLGEIAQKKSTSASKSAADQAKETIKMFDEQLKHLGMTYDEFNGLADAVGASMTNSFMSIVDGTQSTKDAFKSMASDIIKELYRVLVVQQMVGSIATATSKGSGLLGFIGGLAGLKGPTTKASGGALQAGQASVVGEQGREIFVPSTSGRVLSVGQAQSAAGLGGGGNITVVQHNSFGAGVSRAEINSMMPKIVETTKAAVLDAKKRGGSYGSAFA